MLETTVANGLFSVAARLLLDNPLDVQKSGFTR